MTRCWDEADADDELAVLAQGRWAHNARKVLTSKRGLKALALIREALLALPEKRLIEGALCTVGGPDRLPDVTEAEIEARWQKTAAANPNSWWTRDRIAASMREEREEEREEIAKSADRQGCGVCVNGALLWHLLVKDGMDPDEAFNALPSLALDGPEGMDETAAIAARDAGIAYTLASELASRNDETFGRLTPEDRYTAFLEWINDKLGDTTPAGAAAR